MPGIPLGTPGWCQPPLSHLRVKSPPPLLPLFGVDIWVEGKPPELVKLGSPFQMWNKGKDSLCPTSRIPRALGVCAGRNQQGGQGMPKSQPNDYTCMCGAAAGGQVLGL